MSLNNTSGYPNMPIPPEGQPMDFSGTTELGVFAVSETQLHALGRLYETWDGKKYRYVKNGAAQLEAALMAQSEALIAELTNEAQTGFTTAVGDTTIDVLVTTASGIVDGDLVDGYLVTQDGTGEGYSYGIQSNTWITGDTVLRLTLDRPIAVATVATSEFTLVKNLHRDVIVGSTTLTGKVVGVPPQVIPANYYGWVQTAGPAAMIVDTGDTLVVGALAGLPGTAAVGGAVGIPAITTDIWGRAISIAAADEVALIDLQLE